MNWIAPIIFTAACAMYAAYSHQCIKYNHGWVWHLWQWASAAAFVAAGFAFGYWWQQEFSFHFLGLVVSAALAGVPTYVLLLHYLNKRYQEKLMNIYWEEINGEN